MAEPLKEFSLEDLQAAPGAAGEPQGLKSFSWEDLAQAAEPEKGSWKWMVAENKKSMMRSLDAMKRMGGETAALADLVLSMPGAIFGTVAGLGTATRAAVEGVPGTVPAAQAGQEAAKPFTAYTAGKEAAGEIAAPLTNPLQKLLNLIGSGDLVEQSSTKAGLSKVGQALANAGLWVERKSGGKISRDAVLMLFDYLDPQMIGAAAGLRAGMRGEARLAQIEAIKRQAMRTEPRLEGAPELPEAAETWPKIETEQPLGGRAEPVLSAEQLDAAAEAKSVLAVKPAVERQATYAENLRAARKEILLGNAAEEQRIASEAAGLKPESVSTAEVLRILRKPPFERTAEDLIALRKARGGASPEMMTLLGVAGIGAGAGAVVDDERLRGAVIGGLTGAGLALPFMGKGAGISRRMGQAGAVKAPGGMWHPRMVEYLGDQLAYKMFRRPEVREANRLADEAAAPGARGTAPGAIEKAASLEAEIAGHSDRMVKNYLNRYAATERDPLKDIEIPSGEGTVKWGDAWDAAIRGYPASSFSNLPAGVRPDEIIWGTRGNIPPVWGQVGGGPIGAIRDYLDHVGDYLAGVPLDQLKNYDLVRAVRETAAADARAAKAMEKEAKGVIQQLPVHREYPDGFRWVELKAPEELSPEQAKRVRPVSRQEYTDYKFGSENTWVAVDSQGKPVKNSFTGDLAVGRSPQEAYLAGLLAQEGNQMGHCVGGYCAGVAAGEQRIFSLRDPEGRSHVTVETGADKSMSGDRLITIGRKDIWDRFLQERHGYSGPEGNFNDFVRTRYPDVYQQLMKTDNILQIKGKQNRAPVERYLPYVQDFVRGGKWGEVGDLKNTGLDELTPEAQKQYGLPRFATSKEFAAALRRTAGPESGRIDPALLKGMAAVGLGGLAGSQILSNDPYWGAALGGALGATMLFPGGRRMAEEAVKKADYGLGLISTRIGNISPATLLAARTFEMNLLRNTHDALTQAIPFMKELQAVKGERRAALDRAILTNDPEEIAALMQGYPELQKSWTQVRALLDQYGEQLKGYGRFKEMRADYFPRLVKDVEGLKAKLGTEERAALEDALFTAERKSLRERGTPLSMVEKSAIINREILARRRQVAAPQPGFARGREVSRITEDLQPFYYNPQESLYAYVRSAQMDLEMAKFFGKDLVQREIGGQKFTDVEASIGNVVGKERAAGRITPEQEDQLISMLSSRFRGGEQAPSRVIQWARNLGYAGLLGNVVSAGTQMADAAMAVYKADLRSTLAATAARLRGGQRISADDFALTEHLAEEFSSASKTADWLNKVLKSSGFTAIDKFGKETVLNAALSKAERQAKNPAGIADLQKRYSAAYGEEFPALLEDLKKGKVTDRVRAMLFSELADMQPISKLEVPQAYLDHPNWRMAYMLKTFMLKQFDIVRRDAWNQIKAGNVKEGLGNLTKYAVLLGVAGASTDVVRDWISGREVSFGATDIMENVLKTFAWSKYVREKAAEGKVVEAVSNVVAPPFQIIDDLARRDPRTVSYIPILGKVIYERWLGGKERAELGKAKLEGTPRRELSPEARDWLKQRSREARERKREERP